MLLVRILIILVLLTIFYQDNKERAIFWFLFPVLIGLLVADRFLQHQDIAEMWQPVAINVGFLIVLLLLVSAWFSLKIGRWVNISNRLLGWGDMLFLLSIAFYLSVLNFQFFYVCSLVMVLLVWIIWQQFSKIKDKQIPLAGLQAIIFSVFLASDWWYTHINITNDDWLLRILMK